MFSSPERLFKSSIMPNGISNMLFPFISFWWHELYTGRLPLYSKYLYSAPVWYNGLKPHPHHAWGVLECPDYFQRCWMIQDDNKSHLQVITFIIIWNKILKQKEEYCHSAASCGWAQGGWWTMWLSRFSDPPVLLTCQYKLEEWDQ